MNKKLVIIGCVIVIAITAVVGFFFRSSQEETEGITLVIGEEEINVGLKELKQTEFEGDLIDGKGDTSHHAYEGVNLAELLNAKKLDLAVVSDVEAVSADQYAVSITGDELREGDRVYIAVSDNGQTIEGIDPGTEGAQLIVFGDDNSKRCVRFLNTVKVTLME